jgi:hypothetical protein
MVTRSATAGAAIVNRSRVDPIQAYLAAESTHKVGAQQSPSDWLHFIISLLTAKAA